MIHRAVNSLVVTLYGQAMSFIIVNNLPSTEYGMSLAEMRISDSLGKFSQGI